ncbi:hypothetical protein B0H14DRAFT_3514316 [Mycena olivaceomarginata]|nr:hypothetical protein B0H14DRAFT_3514316 [Mycena olivaceomarginata]
MKLPSNPTHNRKYSGRRTILTVKVVAVDLSFVALKMATVLIACSQQNKFIAKIKRTTRQSFVFWVKIWDHGFHAGWDP